MHYGQLPARVGTLSVRCRSDIRDRQSAKQLSSNWYMTRLTTIRMTNR